MNISPMISLSKTYWNRYFVGEISRTQKTNNHKDNKKQPHGRSLFSRGFVRFLTISSKTFEKTTMKQKKRLGDYIRPNISLESFFFESFWFLTKSGKTLEKTKKHKKRTHRLGDYMRPETFPSNLCLLFLFFFGFLKIFATFGQKPKKPRENQKNRKKKTKKTKKKNKKNKD